MAKDSVKASVSIFINDKEVKRTLNGVGNELGRLRREIRQTEAGSEEFNKTAKEIAKAEKEYKAMNDEIRELGKEIKETDENADGLFESFGNIRDSLGEGDFAGAQAGLAGLTAGLKNLAKAAWAFISTGVGAIIAGLVVGAVAVKSLFDYNKQLHKLNDELRALGVTALEMSEVRSEVQATAETFDKEFSDIARKAKSLSEAFGISMSEANEVIARGLADGGKMNDEFLDSLGEYDVFFEQAGYSAQQFVDIVNTGFELGIYSDKLPDAIKEAGLSLREQTTATRDALVNAFGATFADDILDKIDSGQMTVREGLEAIAKQAEETGLTQQQQAQLTADIFRGAGEDAGGAMKIFEAISKSTQREMSAMAKSELEVLDANERLNKAQAELFEIGGLSEVWNNVKASALDAFADILSGFTRIFASVEELKQAASAEGQSQAIKDVMRDAELFNTSVAEEAKIKMQAVAETVKGIQEEIAGLSWWQGDDALQEQLAKYESYYAELEKIAAGTSDEMSKAQEDEEDGGGATNDDAGGGSSAAVKAAEEAKRLAEEQAEREKQAAEEKKAREKAITDFIIAERRRQELAGMTAHDREVALIKDKYAQQIAEAEGFTDKIKELEALRDEELNALKEERLIESQERISEIEAENRALKKEAELERQMEEAETQEEKEELMLEHQRELALNELDIEMEKQLALAEMNGATEEELIAIKKNFALKKEAMNRGFAKSEKALADDVLTWHEMTEEQKVEYVRNGLATAAQYMNEGSAAWKATKIAETTIATYQSAVNAYNSLSQIPVVGPALGAVAAAFAVASGIKNIQKISSTKIEKIPEPKKGGKYKGGFTGKEPIGRDQDGNITGWVHEDEWVSPKWMTTSPKYAATIGWLEQERTKGMSGYANGGYASAPPSVPGVPATENGWKIMLPVMNQLVSVLNQVNEGVHAKLYVGYEDAQKIEELNIERKQSEQNGTISQ